MPLFTFDESFLEVKIHLHSPNANFDQLRHNIM